MSVGPISFHKSIKDTEISGFKIPQNTNTWVNTWALLHDKEVWQHPFTFNPDRFLDDEGCFVDADHASRVKNLAFSAGPRVCPGEVFSRAR